MRYLATAVLSLAPALVFAQANTYQIDGAHSAAQFSVRHLMVSNVRGEFSKMQGTVVYDPKNPAATKVEATLDPATINTREAKRDAHLKSADFFDVATYPTLSFKSTKAWKEGDKLKIQGDLTMHGVTKSVVLDVEATEEVKDPQGNMRVGAQATTTINRKDFGLNWSRMMEAGGAVVGDEVKITLDIEAVRKPAPGKTSA